MELAVAIVLAAAILFGTVTPVDDGEEVEVTHTVCLACLKTTVKHSDLEPIPHEP
jgi:hypothetical protein